MPSSCALLGGFAIGARVSLLWQHNAEREMSASACIRSMPGYKTSGQSNLITGRIAAAHGQFSGICQVAPV